MEHCGKERVCNILAIKKWRHYLEDAEILLKSDAKSLQKFPAGRTKNVKLGRWSLDLQGRNIQVEHIPGHKNKTMDCLSRLPFVTRKRNDNPLKDEDISIQETKVEIGKDCCPLYDINLIKTKAPQQSNKHCIQIAKLLEDPRNSFHERDSYGYDDTGLLYHINRKNGKEYKAMAIGHFSIRKTYSLIKRYYYWPKMIKHIQGHVESCSLCQR